MNQLIKALFLSSLLAASAQAQDKPNVVLVVMDNLGWGEIDTIGDAGSV